MLALLTMPVLMDCEIWRESRVLPKQYIVELDCGVVGDAGDGAGLLPLALIDRPDLVAPCRAESSPRLS